MSPFKVYVKDENFKEPEDNLYYLVAANGTFKIVKGTFWTSSTLVQESKRGKDLGFLQEHKSSIVLNLPKKIPTLILRRIISFFGRVHKDFDGAEAIVLIYWDIKKEKFVANGPLQKVGHGTLPYYKLGENPKGMKFVATIHSHGPIDPFHSGIDQKDEEKYDGIHVTIGNFSSVPTFSCSVVSDGERETFEVSEMFEGMEEEPFPEEWLKNVEKAPNGIAVTKNRSSKSSGHYHYTRSHPASCLCNLCRETRNSKSEIVGLDDDVFDVSSL